MSDVWKSPAEIIALEDVTLPTGETVELERAMTDDEMRDIWVDEFTINRAEHEADPDLGWIHITHRRYAHLLVWLGGGDYDTALIMAGLGDPYDQFIELAAYNRAGNFTG